MSQSASGSIENNSNTIVGSTLSNSAVTAGSHARASVSVSGGQEDPELTSAIAELHHALQEARASVDRRDDETRERLELAESRLKALEEELQNTQRKPEGWARVKKLMIGVRDALAGFTSLTTSVDGLWQAVEKVIR
jgi:chromosome segregation ATPase